MRVISWTRAFTSFALAWWERSCESLARRQGWLETWTLEGTDVDEAILIGVFFSAQRVAVGLGIGGGGCRGSLEKES